MWLSSILERFYNKCDFKMLCADFRLYIGILNSTKVYFLNAIYINVDGFTPQLRILN